MFVLSMTLYPLPREEVPAAMDIIDDHARQMAERFPDDWPVEETIRRSTQGDMQLWIVWSEEERKVYAVIGTEVRVAPSGKRVMTVIMAAGREHELWTAMVVERLEEHARHNACTELKIDGRVGWARSLPHYKATHWVSLSRELT